MLEPRSTVTNYHGRNGGKQSKKFDDDGDVDMAVLGGVRGRS